MHRKGGALEALRMEEGSVKAPPASSSQADEDLWKRRQAALSFQQQRQGWNPITVLLCGALLLSLCFSAFMYNEAAEKRIALAGLTSSLQAKTTEFAQNMATTKRQLDEVQTGKRKVEELERAHQKELDKLHEELTNIKHSLHEEQVKSTRLHRDNSELHKKLRVKSNELKVLEDQTRMFEKEMNQLTKTIHTLQGDTQHDVAGNTDYQILYKRQEEQQQRWKDRQEQQTSKTASGKDASSASASSTSSTGHGRTGGKHAKHDSKSQQTKDAAAAASDATAGAGAEGDGGDDLLDDGHEYKDHNGAAQ